MFQSLLAVGALEPLVAGYGNKACRKVSGPHGGIGGIEMLSAWTGATHGLHPYIIVMKSQGSRDGNPLDTNKPVLSFMSRSESGIADPLHGAFESSGKGFATITGQMNQGREHSAAFQALFRFDQFGSQTGPTRLGHKRIC